MDVVIYPYRGINDAELGMAAEQVRITVGGEFRTYLKGRTQADQFVENSIHAYYDSDRLCKAFEIYAPTKVLLSGFCLTGKPLHQVLDWLKTQTQDIKTMSSVATALQFGISLYAPQIDEMLAEPVQSVLVFRRGYWDSSIKK